MEAPAETPVEDSLSVDNLPTRTDTPPIPQGGSINMNEAVQDHPIHDQEKHKENINVMEDKQITQASTPLLKQGCSNLKERQRHRSRLHRSVPNLPNEAHDAFSEWDILGDTYEDISRSSAANPSTTMPYKVGPVLMDTAKAIWDIYGDIGINSSLQSIQFRSAIFALICKVVLEMNKVSYESLDRRTVKNWQEEVMDAEASGWEIGWLRQRIEEVSHNMDAAEILSEMKMKREAERAKLRELDEEIQLYFTLARIFSRKAFELKEDKSRKAKELESKVRVPKVLAKAVEAVSLWGKKAVGDGLLGASNSRS